VRRIVALVLFLACAGLLLAGELPDAPGRDRPLPRTSAAAQPAPDDSTPPAVDLAVLIVPARPVMAITTIPDKPAKKVFDKKFALLAVVATGLTVADYEMTQRCLSRQTCVEADPLLPHSRAGMYATNIPLNAALFYWAYRRKSGGKRLWWLPPLAIIASHAVGVRSNLQFVGR
jgi:hypothetical protein